MRLFLTRWLFVGTMAALVAASTSAFSESSWPGWLRWACLGGFLLLLMVAPEIRARGARASDLCCGPFLLIIFASWAYSSQPTLTLMRGTSVVLLYVAVFWVMWEYADRRGDLEVIKLVAWTLGLVFLVGLAFYRDPSVASWQGDGRFRGILMNPNALGMLGMITFPLLLYRVLSRPGALSYALAGSVLVSVMLSGSRNGMFCCLLSSVYLIFSAGMLRGATVLILLAVLAGGAMVEGPWQAAPDAIFSDQASPVARFLAPVGMAGGRFEIWPMAVEEIERSPWLGYGFGLEEFWMDGAAIDPSHLLLHQGRYMHNSYLGLSYQVGLLGAGALFLPLILLGLVSLQRGLARRLTLLQNTYLAVLLSGLVAAGFESWIYSAGNAFSLPFWTIVMLLVRSYAHRPTLIGPGNRSAPESSGVATARELVPTGLGGG